VNKKKQKNFYPFAADWPGSRLQVKKVFLLLFFQKKKTLAFRRCSHPGRNVLQLDEIFPAGRVAVYRTWRHL
jgi:hypothetical protein